VKRKVQIILIAASSIQFIEIQFTESRSVWARSTRSS